MANIVVVSEAMSFMVTSLKFTQNQKQDGIIKMEIDTIIMKKVRL